MWLRRLSLLVTLIPAVLFSQSEISLSLGKLIEAEKYQEAIDRADSLLQLDAYAKESFYLYSKKGDAYYYLGDAKKSLENYLLATQQPEIRQLENQHAFQEATSYAGFTYGELGIHDKAIDMYKKSLQLAISLNDSVEVATQYFNISASLIKQGNLEEGMAELQKAYEIDLARKDTSAIGFDLNALGYAAIETNRPGEAIQYFKESIYLLNKSEGNYNSLGTRLNNLSKAFTLANQWDSALFYNQKSIDIHKQLNDQVTLAERWINRAFILNKMKLQAQAIGWAQKAREQIKDIKNSDLILKANHELIESYKKIDNRKAIALAKENVQLAEKTSSVNQLLIAYEDYAQLLHSTGNSAQAYETSQAAALLKDSIRSAEANEAVAELSVRYEVDKILSEKEILELQNEVAVAELKTRRVTNRWLTSLIIIILIASVIITYSLISKGKVKEQLLQSEINELRLQIKQLIDYQPEQSTISIEQLNKALKEPLSDREFEVLQMAMTDKNNSEIAEKIFISTNTVKYHLKNIYNKLGVSNRKEALKFAFQAASS